LLTVLLASNPNIGGECRRFWSTSNLVLRGGDGQSVIGDVDIQADLDIAPLKNLSLNTRKSFDLENIDTAPLNETDERDLLRLQLRVAQVQPASLYFMFR
jgi:hypothetical protein